MHDQHVNWVFDMATPDNFYFWHIEYFGTLEEDNAWNASPYLGIVSPELTPHSNLDHLAIPSAYKFTQDDLNKWKKHPSVILVYTEQEKLALQLKYGDEFIK